MALGQKIQHCPLRLLRLEVAKVAEGRGGGRGGQAKADARTQRVSKAILHTPCQKAGGGVGGQEQVLGVDMGTCASCTVVICDSRVASGLVRVEGPMLGACAAEGSKP
jgi:hypothetical protein